MKQHCRPLARHPLVSLVAFVLLLAAFLLVLPVALSLPIIKPVYLLSVKSTLTDQVPTNVATELRFGVWGLCATRPVSWSPLVALLTPNQRAQSSYVVLKQREMFWAYAWL